MRRADRGESLVSLMVALSLSLGIVLSAIHLTVQAELLHQRARQFSLLEDQAHQVIELIERLLQQAGDVDVAKTMPVQVARPLEGAVDGADNAIVSGNAQASIVTAKSVSLASDLLLIHLRGDDMGRVINCAGFPIPVAAGPNDFSGRSVLYVGLDPANEPELRCYFRGASQWSSQALASGVLTFQVRFGLDTDNDGLPNLFVSASQLSDITKNQAASELSPRTRIVALHIALLMRSTQRLASSVVAKPFLLFGWKPDVCINDLGVGEQVLPSQLKPNRLYRQFDKVIFLNNSLRPDA